MGPEKREKIVVIGGGTGSFIVLKGLKKHPVDITAIVTMFDSGGSSGILRDEFGVLPPGDIRRCLVALSEGEHEGTLRDLFNFRFEAKSSLVGHNFGNLLITALSQITNDQFEAIKRAGELLNIRGRVLPVSTDKAHLCAELENGEIIRGETHIDIPEHDGSLRIKCVFLEPTARARKEAVDAILKADKIILGPGDLFTSIIPNLLARGISEAIRKSKAKKIYVLNFMTKWGETNGFSASDFTNELIKYIGIKKFDCVICNDKNGMSKKVLSAYDKERKTPVLLDKKLPAYAKKIITQNFFTKAGVLRHNPDKLAKVIIGL